MLVILLDSFVEQEKSVQDATEALKHEEENSIF